MRIGNSHRLGKRVEQQYKAADLLCGNSATRQCVPHVLTGPHLQEVIQPTSHDHRAG